MKKHLILIFLMILYQPAWAVDDSALPVIPDAKGDFDPASVSTVPASGAKTRGTKSSAKRLPPAPRTKAEIIKLMKKPAKTRAVGGKTRNPKGRAYINFDFGSARVRDDSYALLYEWASALQSEDLSGATIKVLGHTDSVGSEEANMNLGQRRANAVKDRLVEDGVIPSRFLIISYGESQPYVSNSTESGRSINRRVEFVLDYDNYTPPSQTSEATPNYSDEVEDEPYYEDE